MNHDVDTGVERWSGGFAVTPRLPSHKEEGKESRATSRPAGCTQRGSVFIGPRLPANPDR